MKRREFINLSLFMGSSFMFPTFSFSKNIFEKKHLILVELDGGNDGLNTVVPYSSKNYYDLREELSLGKKDLNIIDRNFGINSNCENITSLYKDGNCAIVHGLGYENPKLSHFKSIQLVETASEPKDMLNQGWFTNSLKNQKLNNIKPAHAFIIGKRKKGYLFDSNLDTIHFKNVENFLKESKNFTLSTSLEKSEILDFLNDENQMVLKARNALANYVSNIEIKTKFGESDIESSFKEATKIVKSKLDVPVIKLSHKGYDTHSNQKQRHEKLLKDLDNAIGSMSKELKKDALFDNVLIVTYSEFGRRVKENGSGGTDHGTASVQFVIGGEVKAGMYGKASSLKRLSNNNLIYTTHYRSYYNTILSRWFGNKNNQFNSYDILNFL